MKKEIIKPFDLKKAKAGAKLRTKEGYPVEIFKWDARGKYPIAGIVKQEETDAITCWGRSGSYYWSGIPHPFDLVIVEEVEEPELWSDCTYNTFDGFIINTGQSISKIQNVPNIKLHHDVFATKKQAKSALAMARISQIMANDIEHFGGVVTDEEWENIEWKYVINRYEDRINTVNVRSVYHFLAFHTKKQRDLFLEKYPQLVRDYLMIDE